MNALVSIHDVAKAAKWSYERMRRFLLRRNAELNGMLLVNIGAENCKKPTYALTLQSLERIHPTWFERAQTLGATVEELKETAEERDTSLAEAHRCIGELTRRVDALERRLKVKAA
jgi:hypothetical protein